MKNCNWSTLTTIVWIVITFLTRSSEEKTLISFFQPVHPSVMGWKKVIETINKSETGRSVEYPKTHIGDGIPGMFFGCVGVNSLLFAIGFWIYSKSVEA